MALMCEIRAWTLRTSLALVWLGLIGCSSVSPARYSSPRVTGRVLDTESREPIAGAQVRRVDATRSTRPDALAHGATALDDDSVARTDGQGRFIMPSVRVLGPFGTAGWYSV